jgi:endonuclease/exonuclease/phosphatase (EEP) superfamily protein YafD
MFRKATFAPVLATSLLMIAVLLATGVPSASAASRGSLKVMTQNLYQGTELANTLAAKDQASFLAGVATDYNNVVATNFPERADAIAAEIAQSNPALVGLQEVALWQTFPVNRFGQPTGAPTPTYDFLKILLDSLSARGLHYVTAVQRANFTANGVGLFSSGLLGVSFTERLAILARSDVVISNAQNVGYLAAIPVTPAVGPTLSIGSGAVWVDATVNGGAFRFITTHLSALTLTTGVQTQQMNELLAGPAVTTTLPVVLVGDFNTTPTGAAYMAALGAGFTDVWTEAHDDASGYTAFQVLPTINNPTSNLSVRIDYVLAKGGIDSEHAHLVGNTPAARTPSGLWPSDHAGVVASVKTIEREDR